MKNYTILFALLLLSSYLYSQTNEYGYIINLKGDTVKGYLSFEENITIYKEIYFKKRGDEKAILIEPTDILGFHYYGTRTTYRTMEYIYKTERGSLKTEMYFAKLILAGYTNLYKLQFQTNPYRMRVEKASFAFDGRNTFMYYLLKNGREFQLELEERNYYKDGNEYPTSVRKHRKYLTQLHVAFADCIPVQQELEDVEFKDKDLAKIVTKYNQCKDLDGVNTSFLDDEKDKKRIATNYLALGGQYHRQVGTSFGGSWLRSSHSKGKKWGRMVVLETGIIPRTQSSEIFSGYISFKIGGQYNFSLNENKSWIAFVNLGLRGFYEPGPITNFPIAGDSEVGLGYKLKNMRFDAYLGGFSYGARIGFKM